MKLKIVLKPILDFTLMCLTVRDVLSKRVQFFFYWAHIFMMTSSILFLALNIRKNSSDIGDLCSSVTFIGVCSLAIVKLMVFVSNKHYAMESLENSYSRAASDFTKFARKICTFFFVTTMLANIPWNFMPFLAGEYVFPTPHYIPYRKYNNFTFVLSNIYSSYITLMMSFIQIPLDSIYILLSARVFDLIDETELKIKYLKDSREKSDDFVAARITEMVESQRYCVSEFTKLAGIMDLIILFQIFQFILMACFTSYGITKANSSIDLAKSLICLVWTVYQMFWVCWTGQKVTDKFETLHTKIFWCGWEDFSLFHQKSILIGQNMMMKERKFVGGSLFQVSLESFMWAINESISYYMVLRTITEKTS